MLILEYQYLAPFPEHLSYVNSRLFLPMSVCVEFLSLTIKDVSLVASSEGDVWQAGKCLVLQLA